MPQLYMLGDHDYKDPSVLSETIGGDCVSAARTICSFTLVYRSDWDKIVDMVSNTARRIRGLVTVFFVCFGPVGDKV